MKDILNKAHIKVDHMDHLNPIFPTFCVKGEKTGIIYRKVGEIHPQVVHVAANPFSPLR